MPVTGEKRPSGPLGDRPCARARPSTRTRPASEGERPHARIGVGDVLEGRALDPAAPWRPRRAGRSTSSRVAQRRSGSPSKSVSVWSPTSEKSRHGMTKIIRSSCGGEVDGAVGHARQEAVDALGRPQQPRRSGRRSPASARSRSTHGPAQFTMTRAPDRVHLAREEVAHAHAVERRARRAIDLLDLGSS